MPEAAVQAADYFLASLDGGDTVRVKAPRLQSVYLLTFTSRACPPLADWTTARL